MRTRRMAVAMCLALLLMGSLAAHQARFGFNEVHITYRDEEGRRTLDVNSFQHEHPGGALTLLLPFLVGASAAAWGWTLSSRPRRRWALLVAASVGTLMWQFQHVVTVQTVAPTAEGVAGSVWVGPAAVWLAGGGALAPLTLAAGLALLGGFSFALLVRPDLTRACTEE